MKDIIFDVDGVLLDYTKTFLKWFTTRYEYKMPKNLPKPHMFDMSDLFPGVDIFPYIQEMSTDKVFSSMEPIPGAVEGIKYLAKNFKINAITSAGHSNITHQLRLDNLKKVFNWENSWNLDVIPLRESKLYWLEKYPKGTIFIDDHIKNIKSGQLAGLNTIWFKQDENYYLVDNEEYEERGKTPIIHGWDELLSQIKKISKN